MTYREYAFSRLHHTRRQADMHHRHELEVLTVALVSIGMGGGIGIGGGACCTA